MLRTFSTIPLLLLACSAQLFAQPATLWTRTYGGASFDYCYSVRPTTDNGFILAGYTQSFGAGAQDIYLVKTNSDGDTLWTRTFGSTAADAAWQVRRVPEGGYILSGFTQRFTGQGRDIWLLRVNDSGDTLWTRFFTGALWEDAYSVTPTSDGGFALAGYTQSYGAGANDFYLLKTNSSGDSLWSRTYGSEQSEYCTTVLELPDGYVLGGYANSAQGSSFSLIRTDHNGDSLWSVQPAAGECYSLRVTSDGGFVMVGKTPDGFGSNDWLLVRLNAQGQTLWTSQYGGELDDVGSVVEETQDGGFLCGGYATINIHSQETDFVLWKVAVNGDSLWSASYGGVSNESCSSLQQLEGGSFVAAGGTFSFGEGLYDFYLVRLAAEATPVLTADPPALNFGTRWVDDDSIAAVTLTNSGSEHLSILSAENLDWAIFNVLNFQPVELAPGTSTQFDVRFLPHWAGEFTADTVRVSFDHEDSPLLIPLTGTGAHFDFYPEFTSINFGYNQQDPVHSEDIEFANDGDSIVTITGISLSEHDDFFSFSPQILTAEPGESATLTVVMDATGFPPASYSAELCLQYDQWQDGELCIPVIADLVPPNAAGDVNQPLNYSLSPAYPNPFNPSTTISFGLPQAADVRLTVYDITGREVTTLANARMDAGYHTVEFSAAGLPSGVYLCRLHAGEFSAMRKLVLMK